MSPVAEEGRYQTARVAEGLCQAATDAGVELPKGYAEVVSEERFRLCDQLGVTKLGTGVVLHTAPETPKELPGLLGYADNTGQWYRDGSKYAHREVAPDAHEVVDR